MDKGEAQFVRELQQEFTQRIAKIRSDLKTSLEDNQGQGESSSGGGLALATELRRRYVTMDASDVILDLFNTCSQLFPESNHKQLFNTFLRHLNSVPLARYLL